MRNDNQRRNLKRQRYKSVTKIETESEKENKVRRGRRHPQMFTQVSVGREFYFRDKQEKKG